MLVNKSYQGIITSMEKEGRGFTSSTGVKYSNYKVRLEGCVGTYQMAIACDRTIGVGDEIRFTLKIDKKKKLRLNDVQLVRYDIKFPLRPEPTLF